jgi:preprotein translocase subunit YajC
MFITTAYAAGTAATPPQNMDTIMQFLPMIMIAVVFYLLIIRPQQSAQRKHLATLTELKPGDEVVTGGGIIAKVKKLIDDNELIVEIEDGMKLRILRNTIAVVRTLNGVSLTKGPDAKISDSKGSKAK